MSRCSETAVPVVLVELNGADPVHVASDQEETEVLIVDWDEVREGAMTAPEMRAIAAKVELFSPNTARDLRVAAAAL